MKLENNWLQKSLESLEGENWGEVPTDESSIVIRAMKLRKIPLEQFSIDDIRFMIGQEIGLNFLLVLAIEILKEKFWQRETIMKVIFSMPFYISNLKTGKATTDIGFKLMS